MLLLLSALSINWAQILVLFCLPFLDLTNPIHCHIHSSHTTQFTMIEKSKQNGDDQGRSQKKNYD